MMVQTIMKLGGKGILTKEDIPELNAACERIRTAMWSGRWFTAEEIRMIAGKDGRSASEGLRRLRQLREYYNIKRKRGEGREFLYKMER